MNHGYSYQSTLTASEGIRWRIEDIIGGELRLDFAKPFMPESLARVEPLTFLTRAEKLILNQVRGNIPVHFRTRGRVHSAVRVGSCTSAASGRRLPRTCAASVCQ
jgi:hypothetical protein